MERQIETFLICAQFKQMMKGCLAGIIEKYGLKRVELEILYYLSKCGEKNTSKDIYHYLNMNKGHISQAVDSLCRQGYLMAVTDAEDRRYVHYFMTEKAGVLSTEMTVAWENMLQKVFADVTEEEMKVFRKVILKICENMNHM